MKRLLLIMPFLLLGLTSCDWPWDTPEKIGTPHLVAWWPMNETSGTVCQEIKSGMNGTISFVSSNTAGSYEPDGRVSGCYLFGYTRGGSYINTVTVQNDPRLNFGLTGDFTIETWVGFDNPLHEKIKNKPQVLIGSMIFSKYNPDTQGVGGYYLNLAANGTLSLRLIAPQGGTDVEFNTVESCLTPINPTNDVGPILWAHIAVTVHRGTNSTNDGPKVTFYANGIEVSCYQPQRPTNTLNITNDFPVQIGNVGESHKKIYFDEVGLFNEALTHREVLQIVDEGKTLSKNKE